jgi:hypothetical protein
VTNFGFDDRRAAGTFHAVVAEVAADRLVLTPDAGEPLTFGWGGPSLATEFSVGEDVTYQDDLAGRNVVKNATRTAEVLVRRWMPEGGSIAGSGSFTLTPDCAQVSSLPCGAGSTLTIVKTRYRIALVLGGDSVELPWSATAEVGAWRITNVFQELGTQSVQGGGGTSPSCHADLFETGGVVTALGPAAGG